jgi:predicted membrane protein
MENENISPEDKHDFLANERGKSRGKYVAGFLVILFGIIYLLRELNISFPEWFKIWHFAMICIGVVLLVRHKFQKLIGYVFVTIGGMYMLNEYCDPCINLKIIWPIIIILFGISMVYTAKFGNSKKEKLRKMSGNAEFFGLGSTEISPDDFVDGVSVFGSIKKQVVTKNFLGADLFTLFGGTEINLTQADIKTRAVMDLTTIFGGAEIIVPSDWTVKSEMISIFGGLDDSRFQKNADEMSGKVLVLKGTCVFGGVEIKSYK